MSWTLVSPLTESVNYCQYSGFFFSDAQPQMVAGGRRRGPAGCLKTFLSFEWKHDRVKSGSARAGRDRDGRVWRRSSQVVGRDFDADRAAIAFDDLKNGLGGHAGAGDAVALVDGREGVLSPESCVGNQNQVSQQQVFHNLPDLFWENLLFPFFQLRKHLAVIVV